MATTLLDLTRVLPGHPARDDVCVARLKEELAKEHGVQTVLLEPRLRARRSPSITVAVCSARPCSRGPPTVRVVACRQV